MLKMAITAMAVRILDLLIELSSSCEEQPPMYFSLSAASATSHYFSLPQRIVSYLINSVTLLITSTRLISVTVPHQNTPVPPFTFAL